MVSCNINGSDPENQNGDDNTPVITFTTKILDRSSSTLGRITPDQHRDRFILFSIKLDSDTTGEYRIGARASATNAPIADELISATAAITRTLSTNMINIYLPFHIDGAHFNPNTTPNYNTATTTALTPETQYSIYIVAADGNGSVKKLFTTTTDNSPNLNGNDLYGLPASGQNLTVRTDEPFFLFLSLNGTYAYLDINSQLWFEYAADKIFKYNSVLSMYGNQKSFIFSTDNIQETENFTLLISNGNINGTSVRLTVVIQPVP